MWIREHTSPDAVFLASPDYASAVATLAGRRVFRAPNLASVPATARRPAIERRLLWKGLERRAAERLGLTHVFAGPGDWSGHRPWLPLQQSSALRTLHSDRWGFRVYEIQPAPAARRAPSAP